MYKIGITGSIGMGKTSTASLFEKYNCGVWNADEAVHRLYAKGGEAVNPIAELFPTAVTKGSVNRTELKQCLSEDFEKITLLENIVHPLVSSDRKKFIEDTKYEINVFDIPLLFETGSNKIMDKVNKVVKYSDTTLLDSIEKWFSLLNYSSRYSKWFHYSVVILLLIPNYSKTR